MIATAYTVIISTGAIGISMAVLEDILIRKGHSHKAEMVVKGMKIFMTVTSLIGLIIIAFYNPLG